jgi:CRISPR system Cascade subunit CasD
VTEFLVFRIYAPLSSWGEIAVGETRATWDRPSRSAVLGLIAAGLGIERADQDGQRVLQLGYGVAVRADTVGRPMTDFHTTQIGNSALLRRKPPASRREFLGMEPRATTMSRRGYQQDAVSTVALWERGNPRWSLGQLCDGVTNPHFVLFAGRKANVLCAPLAARLISAETLADAFAAYPDLLPFDDRVFGAGKGERVMIDHDACVGFESGLDGVAEFRRRDAVIDRGRWHFSDRVVLRGVPSERGLPQRKNASTEAPEP